MKKRILTLVLALILVFALVPSSAMPSAEAQTVNGYIVESEHFIIDENLHEYLLPRNISTTMFNRFMERMDIGYQAMLDLVGRAPHGGAKVTIRKGIGCDWEREGGGEWWQHAKRNGIICWNPNMVLDFLAEMNTSPEEDWRLTLGMHELGHIFDNDGGWVWAFNWEFSAELKDTYVSYVFNGSRWCWWCCDRYIPIGRFIEHQYREMINRYNRRAPSESRYIHSSDPWECDLLISLYKLFSETSWEPLKKTYRSYWEDDPSVLIIKGYTYENAEAGLFWDFMDRLASFSDVPIDTYFYKSLNERLREIYPDTKIPRTEIHDWEFAFRKDITSIVILDGVTSIGDWAFMGCTSLTSITIPDGVTSIGDWAFWDCTSLTSITIPDSVTSIGDWAFEGCTSLTSITIPDGVTSIGFAAFRDCTSLTSIVIPSSVTNIGFVAFANCTSLTSIVIPNSVTSIDDWAFWGCNNLTIYGYAGSYAQTYAKTHGIAFSELPPLFGDLAGVSTEGLANIEYVFEKGLMSGSGGNFMPTQAARNAQFLAILSRLAGAGVTDGSPWFAPYVDWARDFGIIGAGEFDADGDMAREDMALWMYRYITISGIELPSLNGKPNYQDIAGLSEEQRVAAEALFDWGIITGATRGEVFGTGASSERVALANVLARFVRMLP